MKELLLLTLCLIGPYVTNAQTYQVIYPGEQGNNQQQRLGFQQSLPVVQNPFSSQQQFPTSNEVLGNFFNGQIPSTQQSYLSPFSNNVFQQQPQQQPASLPYTSNYLAPPETTNIPRQTHFFGNNYDFFRQFHGPQQVRQEQQQPRQQTFQQNQTPVTTFAANPGTTPLTSPVPSSPASTPKTLTTMQFFTAGPSNAFTFPIEDSEAPSSPAYQSPTSPAYQQRPTPTAYQQSSTSPAYPSPTSPEPTHYVPTHRTAVSYPVTVVKHTIEPHSQNSIDNGYEEAAKALGITHGLRVVTTESLNLPGPTVPLATATSYPEATPSELPLTPSTTTSTTTTPTTTPEPYRFPQEEEEEQKETIPTTTTTTTTPAPTTTLPSTAAPILISRGTVRPVIRSSTVQPRAISHRQRQPLYRQPNRIIPSNTIEETPQPQTRPPSSRRLPPLTTTTTQPTTTEAPPAPTTYRPAAYSSNLELVQEQPRPQLQSQPQIHQQPRQQIQQQPRQQFQQQPRQQFNQQPRQQFQQQPRQQIQQQQTPLGHGSLLYNNLAPGLLYTNTNGAYQSYYNGGQQEQFQQVGLEEIEPQIIEFNIPNKMIPIQAQTLDDEEFRPSLPLNGISATVREPQRPQNAQRQLPAIIVTHTTSTLPPPPQAPKKVVDSEVYRVGPKGRLLKKRRRIRPSAQPQPQPSESPSIIFSPTPFSSIEEEQSPLPVSIAPYRPRPLVLNEGPVQPPTTYRPNFNSVSDLENENDEEPEKPSTTYRSRFRYPSRSTSTTETSLSSGDSSPQTASPAASPGGQSKLIESRLKSLERQIRFKNRKQNS